jgi:hypothetical protein
MVVVASGEDSPSDPRQLVRHSNHDDVFGSSGIQSIQPSSDGRSITLDAQHGRSRTVDQNLAQIDVAALADAEQLTTTYRKVGAFYIA